MTTAELSAMVASGQMTVQEALELASKKSGGVQGNIHFKVSEKGGVSVYGLNNRFPVTLYGGQWERLIAKIDDLKKFLADHASELSTKEDK